MSVVIPVYNVAPYLRKCVASVQEQTLRDIEIILVDDGSTDESGQICDELAARDARIRVIHQENQGLAAARNSGTVSACGVYLAYLDSDDYWNRPVALQEMAEMAEKSSTPVDCILFSYTKKPMGEGGETLCQVVEPGRELDVYRRKEQLLEKRQYANSACNKLYRTAFLHQNAIGFPVGMKSEDLIFSQQVLLAMDNFMVYTPSLLVYQTSRNGSISTAFAPVNYEHIRMQMLAALEAAKAYPLPEKRLACAFWAEQTCWFLGFLPQSGKPLPETIQECAPLFEVMDWGICRRAKIVRTMLRLLGRTNSVRLLAAYLKSKR